MFPLIEQNASGYITQDLTGLASYVLTVANNAPDQARSACLRFTGTPATGGCSVTLPAIARIGWASNESTQAVTLMTAGGTISLTIPPAGAFLYRCDGSAVVAMNITPSAQVSAANGVVINVGSAYSSFDSTGTSRPLLDLDASGNTNLFMGGTANWRLMNQAGTTALATITPAGAATFAGPITCAAVTTTGTLTVGTNASVVGNLGVSGTVSVTGAISTAAAVNVGGALTIAGNVTNSGNSVFNNGNGIWAKDTGGTSHPILAMDNANNVDNYAGSANWRVLNQAGNSALLTITPAGAATFLSGVSMTNISASAGIIAGVSFSGSGAISSPGSIGASGFTGNNLSIVAGTIASTSFLNGNVSCPGTVGAAGFVTTSDGRLKSEIAELTPEDGYSWIERARPVSYLMNRRFQTGFIAQDDIARGRKEAVTEVPDDRPEFAVSDGYATAGHRLGRFYEHDVAYITVAMQGMMARIAALEAALAAKG